MCSDPNAMSHASLPESFPFVGAYAVYQCDTGYNLPDRTPLRSQQCLLGAVWNVEVDECTGKWQQEFLSHSGEVGHMLA